MEKYGFFNSVGDDRIYDAEDWALFLRTYFTNGVFNNGLKVIAYSGMSVNVNKGDANINGYRYHSDDYVSLNLSTAHSSLERTDAIVLRWDLNTRDITLKVLTGTPTTAGTSKAPSLVRTEFQYDIKLADIKVSAGTTAINASMITDTRTDENVCGIVAGAVKQIDTNDIFSQYQTTFQEWFNHLENQLTENQVTNLQKQIDDNAKGVKSLSNTNFLINGNFKNLINQRGKTSYFGSTKPVYTIDRWRIDGSKLGVYPHDNYVAVLNDDTSELPFSQYTERKFSGAMTLSLKLSGIDTIYSLTNPDSSTVLKQHFDNNFSLEINGTLNAVRVFVDGGSTLDIEWIKLESGSVATPFVARPKAEELQLCQMFYTAGFYSGGIRYEYGGAAGNDFTYNVRIDFPLMRVAPTYIQGDYKCSFIDTNGNINKPMIKEVNDATPTSMLLTTAETIRKANGCTNILIGGTLDAEIY